MEGAERIPLWFTALMAALAEAFSQEANSKKAKIYWLCLKDIPQTALEAATIRVIKTRGTSTFPKVAEIREAANGEAKPEDVAMLAVAKIERALREIGTYKSVTFDDPVIHQVIESLDGGWIGLGEITDEQWVWVKKDLIKLYQALTRSPEHGRKPSTRLCGITQKSNDDAGWSGNERAIEQIEYVGDKAKALTWTSGVPAIPDKHSLETAKIDKSVLKRLEAHRLNSQV